MLKQSQKRTKRAALTEALMSRHAGEEGGLVGDDADGPAVEAREADDDVLGEVLVHLEEVAVVDDGVDDVLDVVGLVGLGGDEGVERCVGAVDGIGAGLARRVLEVVRRQEAEQLADHARGIRRRRGRSEVGDAADLALCVMAPPSSSLVTSSWVTVLMTSGPVMNM